ncbi:hypothetical protein SCHPADRAFT_891915 [Schizopora paradoxa]|uniref:Uncharacterized protein n=1 Tax=Schizopora paradoxa TaxID=27342 RepID=A0A0H2RGN1_9AGAM|nr:hypothetical protein SCHPADRAFT_891915 [Schizopora paradoxa]
MPVWNVDHAPSRPPAFTARTARANLLNVGQNNNGARDITDFDDASKIEVFDLIVALGLRSGFRSPTHLRDEVDLAHVRNKARRMSHEQLTSVLFEGICTLMEHAEDSFVFANVYRDSRTNYFESNQGREAIENQIHNRLPGRFSRMPTPEFATAMTDSAREIALLLPAFLNEKSRRANWGQAVAQAAAAVPFAVHVRFPPEVLRAPGIPPPEGNGDVPGGDDAPGGGHGPGGDAPAIIANAPPPVYTPAAPTPVATVAAPVAQSAVFVDPHQVDDDDLYSDASFTSEEWAAYEASMDRINAEIARKEEEAGSNDPDERHAEDLRSAMAASRITYANQLAGADEIDIEPIAGSSQGFPARHVDPASGTTVHGTFVPDPVTPAASPFRAPATPSRSRVDNGVWVFLPSQGARVPAAPCVSQDGNSRDGEETPARTQATPSRKGKEREQQTPVRQIASSSKRKGKGPAR